jgi:hypothetical protein
VEDVIHANRHYLKDKAADWKAMIREHFERAMAYAAIHETQVDPQAGDWIVFHEPVA